MSNQQTPPPRPDTRQNTRTFDFDELRDSGILWLINTSVFHPRGMALALDYDSDGHCQGWLLFKDNEAWVFPDEDANESFDNFKKFIEKEFKVYR
jgi:hypothetical protein